MLGYRPSWRLIALAPMSTARSRPALPRYSAVLSQEALALRVEFTFGGIAKATDQAVCNDSAVGQAPTARRARDCAGHG